MEKIQDDDRTETEGRNGKVGTQMPRSTRPQLAHPRRANGFTACKPRLSYDARSPAAPAGSPPCATVGVQEPQSRLFVAGTTTSALRPQLCGYGLSCLVGLNSDFYPLCGFLNGLDTSGRATSGGAPRSCRMPRTISQSPYGFCTQKTWHKLFKPNKKNNWCARFLYIRARGKRLGD